MTPLYGYGAWDVRMQEWTQYNTYYIFLKSLIKAFEMILTATLLQRLENNAVVSFRLQYLIRRAQCLLGCRRYFVFLGNAEISSQ